jgi:hypothetical protein
MYYQMENSEGEGIREAAAESLASLAQFEGNYQKTEQQGNMQIFG